jgi:hypothetical protein
MFQRGAKPGTKCPGSKEWKEADAELKKAEAELYKHQK